jgi:metal iron transporter
VCRGNWGVDLQAGSQFGYSLLFVVLLAGVFGVFFQVCLDTSFRITEIDVLLFCFHARF